jgi:hypothetical protein
MAATADTLETIALADQLRRLIDRVPLSVREVALATGADEPTVAAGPRSAGLSQTHASGVDRFRRLRAGL